MGHGLGEGIILTVGMLRGQNVVSAKHLGGIFAVANTFLQILDDRSRG